jgi:hypothetical protein
MKVSSDSLTPNDNRKEVQIETPRKILFSRRTLLTAMIALPIAGCQNNGRKKGRSEEDIRREILDTDFDAAMRRAGDMRRSDRSAMSLNLTSAFQPFVEKHSLETFEKYFDQRFVLGPRFGLAKVPIRDARGKTFEGFELLWLDWRFYYADRVNFLFEYLEDKEKIEGVFVFLTYIPWLYP